MAYGIFLLPTFRQPSISCNIFKLFDYLCHYSHGLCCRYVLASSVSLALSPFGYHKPAVSSLLICILVTRAHLSLIQTVTCLTIVSHFTLYLFAISCLLSHLLINTLLAAYFSLFAPHCYCPPMFTVLYHCICLCQRTLYSLHTPCLLHAHSAVHSYCPMHTHCLLTTLCALVIHSIHTGHFILTSCFCFLVGDCTRTPCSGHTSFRSWSTPLYASSPFVTQSLFGVS